MCIQDKNDIFFVFVFNVGGDREAQVFVSLFFYVQIGPGELSNQKHQHHQPLKGGCKGENIFAPAEIGGPEAIFFPIYSGNTKGIHFATVVTSTCPLSFYNLFVVMLALGVSVTRAFCGKQPVF